VLADEVFGGTGLFLSGLEPFVGFEQAGQELLDGRPQNGLSGQDATTAEKQKVFSCTHG
jgi:hypothetical protein